jgi:catechol 2,3-dioxygenase-like lactoylglutathione lyase family enzyme
VRVITKGGKPMQASTTMTDPRTVLKNAPITASFAVKDTEEARGFYGRKLGLDVRDSREPGLLEIHGTSGPPVLVYPKPDHEPAVFTVLNFHVRDVDETVEALKAAGIEMEHYDDENGVKTDAKGIARGAPDGGKGPSIAWFRDPSGNILAVLEGDQS